GVGHAAGKVVAGRRTVRVFHTEDGFRFFVVVVALVVPSEVAAHEVHGVVGNEVQAGGGQEAVVEGVVIDELQAIRVAVGNGQRRIVDVIVAVITAGRCQLACLAEVFDLRRAGADDNVFHTDGVPVE